MDFKSFVNSENFKVILLHHLKSQTKQKFTNTISSKIKESTSSGKNLSSDDIVDAVSDNIFCSNEFTNFMSHFLGNLDGLLEDGDKYLPKDEKRDSSSQCSSASSINTSSIDFLSPDQFQTTVQCLKVGTNAEKLEALETLYRLPTLEHIINKSLWTEVEYGIHNSLSSRIIFLRKAALKLIKKMLTSSESKVVQESYLSLVKYIQLTLLPLSNQNIEEAYLSDMFKCTVELIAIINKFLQMISDHWLRYPQAVIENISIQSLNFLSEACKNSYTFDVWTCLALCDPEAKWLKNIIYGHTSRAALLNALENNSLILKFCIRFCDKFISEYCDVGTQNDCCKNVAKLTKITHIVCFLAHLMEYSEGRNLFTATSCEDVASCWTDVFHTVMTCSSKMCEIACFNCCNTVCKVISEKWQHFWNLDISTYEKLVEIMKSFFSNIKISGLNSIYFATQCLYHCFKCIISISFPLPQFFNFDTFIDYLQMCINAYCLDTNRTELSLLSLNAYNSIMLLLKIVLFTPSTLFLNPDFIKSLSMWWITIINNYNSKLSHDKFEAISKYGSKIICDIEENFMDLNLSLLKKPHGIIIQETSAFEASLTILLEKILKDIENKNSVCSSDISILSSSLNSRLTMKPILNKTIAFRVSSVISQLKESCDISDLQALKNVLDMLVSSLFCDLISIETATVVDVNYNDEIQLMQCILLLPNLSNEVAACEDCRILVLQIISLLCNSIYSLCSLEARFQITALLLDQQSHYISTGEEPITDPECVLRNHILVKLFALGGSGEKVLPPDELTGTEMYEWPFIVSYPIPDLFYKTLLVPSYHDIDLDKELQLSDLQAICLDYFKIPDTVSIELCFHLLKKYLSTTCTDLLVPNDSDFSLSESMNYILHKEEVIGLKMTEKYGQFLNLITKQDSEQLVQLLAAAKSLIGSNSKKLDVFVCSLYLMCKGDFNVVMLLLKHFLETSNVLYVWFEHLSQVSELCPNNCMFVHNMLELCDLIVKKTLPRVFSVFQFFGFMPSTLFNYWTGQCYWNYLDFIDISQFILLNVLFSNMFSIYFFVSILKHLQVFILQNAHNSNLITILKNNPIENFKVCNYIGFIVELCNIFSDMESKYLSKYSKLCISKISNIE